MGADAELALHGGDIPLVPMLNILCSKFCAIPIPLDMRNNLEILVIISLIEGLDKKKVSEEHLWYHYDSIIAPLFETCVPQRVQLLLGNLVTLFSVDLHYLRRS